jgi:type IV fimbrial biogenesis protein FimT
MPMSSSLPTDRTTGTRKVSQPADENMIPPTGLATRASRGFSLVELMVALSIVGITLAIGVPSYRYVTNSNRVSAEVNQLLGDMQYARSEAVKEGTTVSVCPAGSVTITGTTATGTCAASGATWQSGWVVFADLNGNGALDAGDQILKVQPPFSSNDTFTSQDTAVNVISFNREGFTANIPSGDNTGGNGGLLLKLNVTPVNQQWERCLVISFVGVMKTLRGPTSPCN